jgi:hypothetical protein
MKYARGENSMDQIYTSPGFIEAVWENSPWGMVAIDRDGWVCAVNFGFEYCTNITREMVLDMCEADFIQTLVVRLVFEHRRMEIANGPLKAIYYFRGTQLYDLSVKGEERYCPD